MDKNCPCRMCLNATVDGDLNHDNDFSSIGIGSCETGLRMMFITGNGQPTEILVERWYDKHGWLTVGYYRPAYCPNCGRLLVENLKDGGRRLDNGQ